MTVDNPPPSTAVEDSFAGTRRFAVLRRLGAGGAGVVYEAHDRELGARVALKRLRRLSAVAILSFKSEFRAIEDVEHPNLVGLGELFEEDGNWFFTMELVEEGVDFFTWVRTSSKEAPTTTEDADADADAENDASKTIVDPRTLVGDQEPAAARVPHQQHFDSKNPGDGFDERRLRRALAQLLSGLDALHQAGKVHRDVKPSNALVTPQGRVVLLDFGLAVDATDADDSVHERGVRESVVGTLSYMSPEQAAGKRVDARADMYSVGVVLYRALTGKLPWTSPPTVNEARVLTLPSSIAPNVPRDLDALCIDLLRMAPEMRPTAQEALTRLETATLALEDGEELSSPTPQVLMGSIAPPPPRRFVGRELELARLSEAFDRTLRGECVVVAVTGESGLGKTTLVRRFGEAIANSYGAVVLSSRCYERESVPYKAVDGLADALSRWLGQLPPDEARALLPPHAALLAQAFPALRVFAPASDAGAAPQNARERRALLFSAARALFANLAARLPVVIVLDDLQWGGADSLALLHEALRPPDAPSLLLVATLRDVPSEDLATKAIHPNAIEVALRALDAEDARELALESLSGLHQARGGEAGNASLLASRARGVERSPTVKDALLDAIVGEAGGHPLFIETLARGLLSRPESTLRAPRLDDTLATTVASLEPAARDVVVGACVAAAPIRADVLARAVGAPTDLATRIVRGLQVARLVRTRGEGRARTVEAYHDRIRHAVAARLSDSERRSWHTRLGESLEALDSDDVDAMAAHFLNAGDKEKAARALATAADKASAAMAYDRAASLERERLALGVLEGEAARGCRTRLAEALVAAGRGAEAANAFLAAASDAAPRAALDLKRRAAEQLLMSGHMDRGLAVLHPVLESVGAKAPATRAAAAASLAWGRARLAVRGLSYTLIDNEDQAKPDLLRRIDALSAAAAALGMVDTIRGADFQTRHLLSALDAGEPRRLARAVALEASFSAAAGTKSRERTSSLLALAEQLSRRMEDPQARVWHVNASGITSFLEGRFFDAHAHLDRAAEILRNKCEGPGMAFAIVNANLYDLGALIHLGELTEIDRRLPALIDDATLRNDRYALTHLRGGVHAYAALIHGDLDTARREAHAAIQGWSRNPSGTERSRARGSTHMPHFFDMLAQAQIHLYARQPREAFERADEGYRALRRAMLLRAQFVRVKTVELRARSALALSLVTPRGSERDTLVSVFDRDVEALREEGAPWASALAQLASATKAAAYSGGGDSAAEFDHAAAMFERANMGLHAAIARVKRGGEEGQSAQRWLESQGVGEPGELARTLSPN